MRVLAALLALACEGCAETWSYWIQPCDGEVSRQARCEAADTELAVWALESWSGASGGEIALARSSGESAARIRMYWVSGAARLYGETRPILVHGKPGAIIYVLPDVSQLGPDVAAAGAADTLFRQAVVYLTCLHESGHAFGLPHTRNFDDIMYAFSNGGDIVEYFSRYRRKLSVRADIRRHSGLSDTDRQRLAALLRRAPEVP